MKKETIDFGGVPEDIRQRGRYIEPGDYPAKIAKVTKQWKDGDKSNIPYFQWIFTITKGKYKGSPLYYVTSLKTEALFNLRNVIFAATGKNVAGKKLGFDPETLIGKRLAVTVEDDEYEGKTRSRAVDVQPIAALEEQEEEEEEEDTEEEEEEEEEELEEVDLESL